MQLPLIFLDEITDEMSYYKAKGSASAEWQGTTANINIIMAYSIIIKQKTTLKQREMRPARRAFVMKTSVQNAKWRAPWKTIGLLNDVAWNLLKIIQPFYSLLIF